MKTTKKQTKKQTWSRTQRRENREFLIKRLHTGETSSIAQIVAEVYGGSWKDARKYLLYS